MGGQPAALGDLGCANLAGNVCKTREMLDALLLQVATRLPALLLPISVAQAVQTRDSAAQRLWFHHCLLQCTHDVCTSNRCGNQREICTSDPYDGLQPSCSYAFANDHGHC